MGLSVQFSTLTEMFSRISEKFSAADRPVLMVKANGAYRGISYRELYNRVEVCALGLSAEGVNEGDRVALISENRPEWVFADLGMMHCGAVNVPLYPTMTPKQYEHIFNDAGVSLAIVSNQMHLSKVLKIKNAVPTLRRILIMNDKGIELEDGVGTFTSLLRRGDEALPHQPAFLASASARTRPDKLMTIIYTSGTTGNPKGVMLTHANLASNITASSARISIEEGDILLSYLPLCHSFERMAGYYTAMACGATIAYAESVDTVAENILEVRPTIMASVPRLFERIHQRLMKQIENHSPLRKKVFFWGVSVGKSAARARRKGSAGPLLTLQHRLAEQLVFSKIKSRTGGRVRFFVSGGAPLSAELGEFFEAVGLPIIEGYGLSETSPVISVNALDNFKFGTVGQPIPGVEVKIAEDGEIMVRGPNIMHGYWNDPVATAEALDHDGWLRTGDIGELDAEGFLRITDRKKHLLVSSGGKNIAPQPVEHLFMSSIFIDQFVLIGDRRMYCAALIVPDFEALKARHVTVDAAPAGSEGVVDSPALVKFFEEEIDRIQRDLPNYEKVRRFTLLRNPFTVEEGTLTPTLKIKRKAVEEQWKPIIDKMYEGRN